MRTPAENEAFVREHWDAAEFRTGNGYDGLQGRNPEPAPTYWFVRIVSKVRWEDDLYFSRLTLEEAWDAAAEFTEQRLKEIQEVVDDLEWVLAATSYIVDRSRKDRVLARTRVALADLKKGMRP